MNPESKLKEILRIAHGQGNRNTETPRFKAIQNFKIIIENLISK